MRTPPAETRPRTTPPGPRWRGAGRAGEAPNHDDVVDDEVDYQPDDDSEEAAVPDAVDDGSDRAKHDPVDQELLAFRVFLVHPVAANELEDVRDHANQETDEGDREDARVGDTEAGGQSVEGQDRWDREQVSQQPEAGQDGRDEPDDLGADVEFDGGVTLERGV